MIMSADDVRSYGKVLILNEMKDIEKDIVNSMIVGRKTITRNYLSEDAINILNEKGYSVVQVRKYNEGGYIISW